jgi:hypothetical protein
VVFSLKKPGKEYNHFWDDVVCEEHWLHQTRQDDPLIEAWVDMFGPIPSGFVVLRLCDTPNCISPFHLFLGDEHDVRILQKLDHLSG